MDISDIIDRIDSYSETEFVGGVEPIQIDQAELTLGVKFPPEYRLFLSSLGCGSVSFQEFIGLGGSKHLNVVDVGQLLRRRFPNEGFPKDLVPVLADGFGNYECIDTSSPTGLGEYQIVQWLLDSRMKGEILGKSYFEWFNSALSVIDEVDE